MPTYLWNQRNFLNGVSEFMIVTPYNINFIILKNIIKYNIMSLLSGRVVGL